MHFYEQTYRRIKIFLSFLTILLYKTLENSQLRMIKDMDIKNKLAIQNELTNEEIKNVIYTIRGKQVMIDSDVAMLYHYETKNVNKAVKRNIDRFLEEFCFQLTENEFETLRFQIGTSKQNLKINDELRGGRRYLPYVFTEQGILLC